MPSPFNDPTCGSGRNAKAVPYVMGTARGVRAFNVDQEGRLRGITYPQIWREGENVAQCYVTDYFNQVTSPFAWMMQQVANTQGVGGFIFPEDGSEPYVEENYMASPCSGVERRCTCGFYAYHTDLHAYGQVDRAVAIVEAYGRVVLGPKGFRAQKARIVGIVPPYAQRDLDAEVDRLKERIEIYNQALGMVPDKMWRLATSTRGIAVMAAMAGVLMILKPVPALYGATILGALTGLGIFAESHCRAALRTFQRSLVEARNEITDELVKLRQDRAWHMKLRAQKLRENYPNIPFYNSLDEMLEAHPTTDLGYLADPKQEHPNS